MSFTNLYSSSCSVLIMDNCHIHYGEKVCALIEVMYHISSMHCSSFTNHQQVCKLIFLPYYFPDYNPIEQAFSTIKAYFQYHHNDFPMTAIAHACHDIIPDKAEDYLKALGYIM